jgi:Transposase
MTPTAEQQLINNAKADRAGREKSTEVLVYKYKTSRSTAVRTLHKYGLLSVKPTRKPGLSNAQRAARLNFCLKHQEWSLEEWKRVI